MTQAKRATFAYKKRDIPVKCECGYETRISESGARVIGRRNGANLVAGIQEWRCSKCRKKDQDDVNQAILNVAKRKGLI